MLAARRALDLIPAPSGEVFVSALSEVFRLVAL